MCAFPFPQGYRSVHWLPIRLGTVLTPIPWLNHSHCLVLGRSCIEINLVLAWVIRRKGYVHDTAEMFSSLLCSLMFLLNTGIATVVWNSSLQTMSQSGGTIRQISLFLMINRPAQTELWVSMVVWVMVSTVKTLRLLVVWVVSIHVLLLSVEIWSSFLLMLDFLKHFQVLLQILDSRNDLILLVCVLIRIISHMMHHHWLVLWWYSGWRQGLHSVCGYVRFMRFHRLPLIMLYRRFARFF